MSRALPANVYIIREAGGGAKIGISDDPTARMLPGYRRATLTVVASYPRPADARLVERVAHKLLIEKRLEGEWFDVTDKQAIAAVKEAIAIVDAGGPVAEKSISFRVTPEQYRRLRKHIIAHEIATGERMTFQSLIPWAIDNLLATLPPLPDSLP